MTAGSILRVFSTAPTPYLISAHFGAILNGITGPYVIPLCYRINVHNPMIFRNYCDGGTCSVICGLVSSGPADDSHSRVTSVQWSG